MANRRKHWFYKTLFSYLPIFFIITSILFLIFFLAFSEYIKKSTVKANEVLGKQVGKAVENLLEPIDKVIIRDILADETIRLFIDSGQQGSFPLYQIHKKLNNLIATFPIIDSVYIYRRDDGMVVSESMFSPVGNFADRQFVYDQLQQPSISWSGKRIYPNPKRFEQNQVVSLVRKMPFLTGKNGLIVVNIRVDSIRELILNMSSQEINFVHVYDAGNNLIAAAGSVEETSNKELTRIRSAYTGWEIRSGVSQKYTFAFFSSFPYFWVVMGLVSILLGIVLIIYVTRRNYKPIELIIERINDVFIHKNNESFGKGAQDELRYISLAIDQLVEQAKQLQEQFDEDLLRIRRHLFFEILEGSRHMDMPEWKAEMGRLGLPVEFKKMVLAVLEIDKYPEFCRQYSERDQYLLKFVIKSVVGEISQEHNFHVWTEWASASQLGLVFMIAGDNEPEVITRQVSEVCGKVIAWVNGNLIFSVTFGIGGLTGAIEHIPQLYDDAHDALKYKSILGNKRVIHYCELPQKPRSDIYNHVQLIRALVQSYRMGDKKWEDDFTHLMDELMDGIFPREDVSGLLTYLIYYLDREIMELSQPVGVNWKKYSLPKLNSLLDRFETLEEFRGQALQILQDTEAEFSLLRENRSNYQLIHNMRKYIENNFSDPDLSLLHLSKEFNLSTRYLSRLFKDEFGEKFVDYLVRVRMENARRLLKETNDPVQNIAVKVGYLHSFSFIRVFKKTVGITPGDYRK